MTPEDYVSYPVALALKKAGFDWKCHYHYDSDRGSHIIEPNYTANDGEGCQYITADDLLEDNNDWQYCSAPTLAVAQKWLREVKGFQPEPQYYLDNRWICVIKFLSSGGWKTVNNEDQYFPSYEAALSAGIEAALELIEKEGE